MTPAACALLSELHAHNHRDWLRAHRMEYDALISAPLADAAAALTPAAQAVDPDLEPGQSRPYRDARYARPDRGPLHEAAWVVFRNRRLEAAAPPAFFLEVSAEGFSYGMGFYSAPAWKMAALRLAVDGDVDGFSRAVRSALAVPGLTVCGDFYVRAMGAHLPEALRPWYTRKNIHVEIDRPPDAPPDAETVAAAFAALGPLYRFWRDARPEG